MIEVIDLQVKSFWLYFEKAKVSMHSRVFMVQTVSAPGGKRRKRALVSLCGTLGSRPFTPKQIARLTRYTKTEALWLLLDHMLGRGRRDVIEAAFWISFDLPPGAENPFAFLGMRIFPASIIMMILRQKGPTKQFIAIGATSPKTARKPASAEVTNQDLMAGPLRRRVLVPTGDGRYYVDLHRRTFVRRRLWLIVAMLAVATIVCAWRVL